MPVVWCRGISEMFGDVWDRGGVYMDSSVIWSHLGQILNFKKIDPGQP